MSQSQAQKLKEAIGRRQFNISPSEQLIDHLSCKYKSKLSAAGALWIFKWHFCYYSNLFGTETKIRIRISEIAKISSSGNSSIEILTTKNNELHKFVGFPSKDRRDTVVRFITKQYNQHKQNMAASFSPVTPSINHPSPHAHAHVHAHTPLLNDANSISSLSQSHSHSHSHSQSQSLSLQHISSQSPNKPEDSFAYKTATIHPKSTPPPQIANNNNNNNNNIHVCAVSSNLNIINDNGNTSDMVTHSQPGPHITPARFITHDKNVLHTARLRRKSSGSLSSKNSPNFRLQSIHSQHSLQFITPQANSDSEDEQKKNVKSGMDTLDIYNLERSLSIHSDDTHQNRLRSWSDSDMPHHGDIDATPSPKSHNNHDHNHGHDKGHKTKSHFAGGWLRIFQSKAKHQSHTKQNKKKTHHQASASASLSIIHKPPPPKVPRTRSFETPEQNGIPKENDISRSQSVPEENKEGEENNTDTTNPKPKSLPSSLTQYINDSYALTPIHLGSFQNLEWKPLYSDDFWTKPALLFHEAFSDAFIKKMHSTRKSTGLKIGEWNIDDDEKSIDNQPITYMRKSEYISKIKDPPPFMPAKTEVYETQRFRFYGRDRVVVDAAISTPNIKYGDYFIIGQRYVFTVNEQDDNKTHMDCSIAFKWVKKTWFEKIITSKATSEAEQGMAMWCSHLHEIFQPKISKQEILIKQISNNDLYLPSPRRRVIDKRVIDYFHAPMIQRTRKDIIVNDWVKPGGELLMDVVKIMFRKSSWINLYHLLLQINDVEQHENLITVKHGLMGILLIVFLFVLCNVCWMLMWYWYSSSLNSIIRQQNEILQQQSEVFEQLLLVLKDKMIDCVDGVGTQCNI